MEVFSVSAGVPACTERVTEWTSDAFLLRELRLVRGLEGLKKPGETPAANWLDNEYFRTLLWPGCTAVAGRFVVGELSQHHHRDT